jgi:tetratricopeptide (TPR) repeat protein
MRTASCLMALIVAAGLLVLVPSDSRAGLYYSGEPMAELPSQWRGFLLDHKALRSIAIKPTAGNPASPMREQYLDAAAKLEKTAKTRELTADEKADLGAIYVRLGEPSKAVNLLREAQRTYSNHFAIAANLGTAWQALGDLEQAAFALKESVRLAPGKWQRTEEYQLKLVRLRLQKKGLAELEDLFGVRWVDDDGAYTPGKLAAAQKKKLPEDVDTIAQQLALWLPADGPLLWQLAELANMHGDLRTAAAIMEGCCTQYGMQAKELNRKRQATKEAAEEQAKKIAAAGPTEHDQFASTLKARSKRPLIARFDTSTLPPVSATAVNPLPWALLGETAVDKKFRPTFAKYLQELDGKLVSLTGFMQPLSEELDLAVFMLIEYPVGCWYCEMPETTQIVFVELPAGKTTTFARTMMRVTGRMSLNSTDPEDFLYTIRNAKVSEVD